MNSYLKKLFLFILLIGVLCLFFLPKALYKPIASSAVNVYLFDHVVSDHDTNYEEIGALGLAKVIETSNHSITELRFFDSKIIKSIVKDLSVFFEVVKTINQKEPWDIEIIEHSQHLEIVIHARFNKGLLYKQERMVLSKNFNLLFPYIGGIHFSGEFRVNEIAYLYGFLSVGSESEYISYDNPAVIYMVTSKNHLESRIEFYKVNKDLIYLYFSSPQIDETNALITHLVIPSS